MRDVVLETKDGELVHEGQIPPFMDGHEPDVLLWGDRVFTLSGPRGNNPLIYRECFAVALVN